MRSKTGVFIAVAAAFAVLPGWAHADTVIMKDKTRIKGLILDEFRDRIVVSTAEGEKTLMKDDIRCAVYDDEERALLQTGNTQFKKGNFLKAYYIYDKAAELNPDSEEACQKRDFLRNYVGTKTRYDIEDGVRRKREIFSGASGMTFLKMLQDEMGIVLAADDKYVFVKKIIQGAQTKSAKNFREGDRIVSVWGEMSSYAQPEEVAEMMLRPGQTRIVIERTLDPKLTFPRRVGIILPIENYRAMLGAELKLAKKGIVVARVFPNGPFSKAGIKSGDLVYRIGGQNTRYMPIKDVIKKFEQNEGEEIEVVVHRDIVIWKRD